MSFLEYSESLFETCLGTLGESVQYTPKGGQSYTLDGLFTEEYELIKQGQFDSVVSSSAPMLEVLSRHLKQPPLIGDRVCIRDKYFRVVEPQPNNEGQIKLILKRCSSE